jgi:pimeloyl-ACP methyl ester carboxylesterase
MSQSWMRPFVEQGYTVWWVTRKQSMPKGHSFADMADDYGQLIADEFGGKADLVLGMSTGGQIGFYLAARHPDRFGHIVILVAGYEDSERGKEILLPMARLLGEGRTGEAMATMLKDMYPSLPRGVGRVVGAVMGRLMYAKMPPSFRSDVMVEAEAELACDAREVLPDITVPVLLVCGDHDPYYSKEVYEETARLIPDCTLRMYEGAGHDVSDKRFAQDVLDFVGQRSRVHPDATDHIREEGRVEAPVEHVWAFLCDTSRWHDWDPRSEYSDFSGPVNQVGTTFVETSRLLGWDMRAHHTVVEVEPQRLLHHRSDKGFDIFFRLEPDGDATHLIVDCDYRLPGRLPGFAKDLLSRILVERTMRDTGERFRALAEATIPAPA